MEKIAIKGEDGVIRFVEGVRKILWFKKIKYTTIIENAKCYASPDESEMSEVCDYLREKYGKGKIDFVDADGHFFDGSDASGKSFYVIARCSPILKRLSYYDWEMTRKKHGKRVSEFYYRRNIAKALFFKSGRFAEEVLSRLRASGEKYVSIHRVYLTRVNECAQDNIIVAVRDSTAKRRTAKFIKEFSYVDGNGLQLAYTLSADKAYRFSFAEYCDIFKVAHAYNKGLKLFPYFIAEAGAKLPKASEVTGRVAIETAFKLKLNNNAEEDNQH